MNGTRHTSRASNQRVVVTGIGAVSAWGWGVEPLWQGLRSGQTGIRPTELFDTTGQRTRIAGEVPAPTPELVADYPGWGKLAQADRFAVVAAGEAWLRAGLTERDRENRRAGTYLGGSTAGMLECEEYLRRLLGLVPKPPQLALLASQQVNAPGDAVARHLRLCGPVETVSSACSSGALSIGAALDALRRQEIDLAVAGGSDSLCLLTYSGFNSLRSVDEQPCRPFRGDRAGLSIGEGAGLLVLERLDDAVARGAEPLAELLGAGASCDAHHMTAPHPEGEGAALAINQALSDAGVEPADIGFINAHGTGTPLNDLSEWAAMVKVFGERARHLPVTASKGSLGHLLGCSGAIEAVATILGLRDGQVYMAPGGGEADQAMAIDIVLDKHRPIAGDSLAVSTSFAFGGANAALVIGGWSAEAGS
jgi:3-oxoacyl-[acyl-carrier-protein] synthase II